MDRRDHLLCLCGYIVRTHPVDGSPNGVDNSVHMNTRLRQLLDNPFTRIELERVRERAYYRSLKHHDADPTINWLAAEEEEALLLVDTLLARPYDREYVDTLKLLFEDCYTPIRRWSFDLKSPPRTPEMLGTREPRRCSICQRTKPEVKFKSLAHVFPEQLGWRYLATFDECDKCNEESGRDFETGLGAMLLADRAIAGVPKKGSGTTEIKHGKDRASLGGQPQGMPIEVKMRLGDDAVRLDVKGPHTMTIQLSTPLFRPRRVAKAIAKMTWQALPEEMRAEFDDLRRYIRNDVEVSPVELYRYNVPGLSLISFWIWRRTTDAPADLPRLVVQVTCANNVIVWTCPDILAGKHARPLLPPILRRADGTPPSVTKFKPPGDDRVLAGVATYELGFRTMHLLQTHGAIDVKLETYDGDVLTSTLRSKLEANNSAQPIANPIRYDIRGGDLIGLLHIERQVGSDRHEVYYDFAPADRAGMDINPSRRLLTNVWHGQRLRVVADDGREVVDATGRIVDPEAAHKFNSGLLVSEWLAVLQEAFGVKLPFPVSLDDYELSQYQLLAEGTRRGIFRQRVKEAVLDLAVNKQRALEVLQWLEGAPITISTVDDISWEVGGQVLNFGPVQRDFEGVRSIDPLDQLRATVDSWSEDEAKTIRVKVESIVYEFERFIRGGTDDAAQPAAAPDAAPSLAPLGRAPRGCAPNR